MNFSTKMAETKSERKVTMLNKSVSWVTPYLGRNGKLMYMGPLLTALSERCRDFSVIAGEYGGDIAETSLKIIDTNSMKQFYWKHRVIGVNGFVFTGPGFMRTLSKSDADIFFLVEYSLTTVYGVLLKLLKKPIKLVLVAETKPLQIEGPLFAFIRKLHRRFIVRNVDAILTNNSAGREFLINELLADPDRIVAKPYLVSTTAQAASQEDLISSRFDSLSSSSVIRFINVGQLIAKKGMQHLIAATALLSDNELARMHVDVVGDGDFRDELEKLVADNGLTNVFYFHGSVEYKEVADIYANAHVFVFPSLYDYRALAPFEALSAGLPMLSSVHDGGAVENVIDGENGYCFDPNNHEQFAAVLRKILDDPARLKEFSMKSLEMSKSYTIENAVNNMIEAAVLAAGQDTALPVMPTDNRS